MSTGEKKPATVITHRGKFEVVEKTKVEVLDWVEIRPGAAYYKNAAIPTLEYGIIQEITEKLICTDRGIIYRNDILRILKMIN